MSDSGRMCHSKQRNHKTGGMRCTVVWSAVDLDSPGLNSLFTSSHGLLDLDDAIRLDVHTLPFYRGISKPIRTDF